MNKYNITILNTHWTHKIFNLMINILVDNKDGLESK